MIPAITYHMNIEAKGIIIPLPALYNFSRSKNEIIFETIIAGSETFITSLEKSEAELSLKKPLCARKYPKAINTIMLNTD